MTTKTQIIANIWPIKPGGNDACDICGYIHDKEDIYGIVIECDDGVYRCKVCRGAGKYPSKIQRAREINDDES